VTSERTISLPIFGSQAVEQVPVEELGPNHFRLLHSPGMVEGLAAGDEIEIARDEELGFRVIRRSGKVCAWFYMDVRERQLLENHPIRQDVEELGGRLDGGAPGLLVFTFPPPVNLARIEEVLSGWVTKIPGSSWMFGNVYDPRDGKTPLNWWK
jgi:hypothetical protein